MSIVASTSRQSGVGDAPALSRLRAHVLADPIKQDQLARIERPDDFIDALRAVSADAGIDTAHAEIVAALGDRAPPAISETQPGNGWLPARSVAGTEPPAFEWLHFGGEALTQPFFAGTVAQVRARPFNRLFRLRTSLPTFRAGDADARMPSGFVFHMSRCGSTLLSNMLAAVPHHHVVSEAEPIDAVVQWAMHSSVPLEERIAALRTMVSIFADHRRGSTRHCFIKLDSWHSVALPLFRAAFPQVPWLFLYRDPIEVLVSHLRQPGLQVFAGGLPPAVLDIPEAAALPFEGHAALALARICQGALDHWPSGKGMLVNYDDLLPSMVARIPAHFGFKPDTSEKSMMQRATHTHSKRPFSAFAADGTAKRGAANEPTMQAARTHLRPVYDQLEVLRLAQGY